MTIDLMLGGAISVLNLVIGMFFLKFWLETRDVFFILFSAAFFIECINRVLYVSIGDPVDPNFAYFLVRLASYLCIFAAWIVKNLEKQ